MLVWPSAFKVAPYEDTLPGVDGPVESDRRVLHAGHGEEGGEGRYQAGSKACATCGSLKPRCASRRVKQRAAGQGFKLGAGVRLRAQPPLTRRHGK